MNVENTLTFRQHHTAGSDIIDTHRDKAQHTHTPHTITRRSHTTWVLRLIYGPRTQPAWNVNRLVTTSAKHLNTSPRRRISHPPGRMATISIRPSACTTSTSFVSCACACRWTRTRQLHLHFFAIQTGLTVRRALVFAHS